MVTKSVLASIRTPELRRVVAGNPGPWGVLEYTRIAVEPPEDYVSVETAAEYKPERWVFAGQTRAQVADFFRSCDFTPSQRESLIEKAGWEEQADATAVIPDRDLVLGMSPKARQGVYAVLARTKENIHQTQPFSFRPELLDERLEDSGLSRKTLDGLKKLLYPQGNALLFADATVYMSTITDPRERTRFFRTVSRRITSLVKLVITRESDTNQLANYWDYDGNNKELRPLFESLARVPGGCKIDVAHLLPPFARKRILTFPHPTDDPLDNKRNCHWSALNFFNETPDDRFCDPQIVKQTLDTKYDVVKSDKRLGDVIVLFHPGGEAIHSAVYVADDLVFTKNGGANTQPWIYMRIGDMLSYYAACCPPDNQPQMVILRKKPQP